MLLDRAQFSRADQGWAIFFGEGWGNLNFQIDLTNHTTEWIAVHALHDADAVGWQATLLTKTQHVDPGAGAN